MPHAGLAGTASGFNSGTAGSLQFLAWPRPQSGATPAQQLSSLQQLQVGPRHHAQRHDVIYPVTFAQWGLDLGLHAWWHASWHACRSDHARLP